MLLNLGNIYAHTGYVVKIMIESELDKKNNLAVVRELDQNNLFQGLEKTL